MKSDQAPDTQKRDVDQNNSIARTNWKAIELLLFVALVLGFGGYQLFSATSAQAGINYPSYNDAGIRITKYADPADGTDFILSCQDNGTGCPSSTFVLSDTNPGAVTNSQIQEIPGNVSVMTITESIPTGWNLDVQCPTIGYNDEVGSIDSGIVITTDYSYPGTFCNFYNWKPGAITITKYSTPSIGTNVNFTSTLGDFSLDSAVPDDNDGIHDSIVFTDLKPGMYSFTELDGSNLQDITCIVDSQPVTYFGAQISSTLPVTTGTIYTDLTPSINPQPGQVAVGVEPYYTTEGHGVIEFSLDGMPLPADQYKLALTYRNSYYDYVGSECTGDIELYGNEGDGAITSDDLLNKGTLLNTFTTYKFDQLEVIDVSEYVNSLVQNDKQYVRFLLEPADNLECQTNFKTYQLQYHTPWGIEVDLGGGEQVACTFTNYEPNVSFDINKVVVGGEPDSDWEFSYGVTNAILPTTSVSVPAAGGSVTAGPFSIITDSVAVQISETVKPGYIVDSTCDNGATGGAVIGYQATDGDASTCTFTNTKMGGIVVEKLATPADSGNAFSFTLSGTGVNQEFALQHSQIHDSGYLTPGVYSLSETPVAGWQVDSATCTAGTPEAIDVQPGAIVTCTIANSEIITPVVSADVVKTVGTDADTCATTQELQVDAGTDVYFCFTVTNTGNVTISEHNVVDASLGLTVTITQDLPPGESLEITNAVLEANGEAPLLGPVTVNTDVTNTMVYQLSDGERFTEGESTAKIVLAPTALDDTPFPDMPLQLYLPQLSGE